MKKNRKLGGGEAGFPLKLSSLISARRAVSQSGQAPNRAPIPPQPPHPTSPTREISIAGLLRSLSATFILWERSSLWWTAFLDYWNWMKAFKCGIMAPKVQKKVWFPNRWGTCLFRVQPLPSILLSLKVIICPTLQYVKKNEGASGPRSRVTEVGSLSARVKMATKGLRQAHICYFRDKCVVFARNCKIVNLAQ